MFDTITSQKLGYYVYALVNPLTKKVFYIGKGIENRVFSHLECALDPNQSNESDKLEEIRDIIKKGNSVEHYILRHGLTEDQAFMIESTLIDFASFNDLMLKNEVRGHGSEYYGIKSTDEIVRQYNAPKLDHISDPVIIININKKYKRFKNSAVSIYDATREAWVVSEQRRSSVKYALAEYQGIIVAVYKIDKWFAVQTSDNQKNNRWGFEGSKPSEVIIEKYLNKSIAHAKKPGAANPIRFSI